MANSRVSPTRRDVVIAGHTGDSFVARAALASSDSKIRASGYQALARGDQLEAADLAAAASDPDPVVRLRAATIAGRWPNQPIDLLALLRDTDASVAETAAWAAGERTDDPVIVEELIALASGHDDPLVREAAVAALGSLEAEAGLETIIAACTDKPTIRRRAVLALAPFSGPRVDAALTAALTDRDWQTRQAAEDLLG